MPRSPHAAPIAPRSALGSALVAAVAALALVPAGASAQDLILNGTSTTLGGTVTFDDVVLTNGATINIAAYNGDPTTTGILHIIADTVTIDATSSIVGDGLGYQSTTNNGQGPGGGQGGVFAIDGGGGGAHGGAGGDGIRDYWQVVGCGTAWPDGGGGAPYGTSTYDIDMGSAGGAGGSGDGDTGNGGGNGGAAVWIEADTIDIAGTIDLDGQDGFNWLNDSGGGGAGGGILLWGLDVAVSALGGGLRFRKGPPMELEPSVLVTALKEAISHLQPELAQVLAGVPVTLVERPDLGELRRATPPLPPTVVALLDGDPGDHPETLAPPSGLRIFTATLARYPTFDDVVGALVDALSVESADWLGLT